jgi:hypothetical protein
LDKALFAFEVGEQAPLYEFRADCQRSGHFTEHLLTVEWTADASVIDCPAMLGRSLKCLLPQLFRRGLRGDFELAAVFEQLGEALIDKL